jgi:hypothetical protein
VVGFSTARAVIKRTTGAELGNAGSAFFVQAPLAKSNCHTCPNPLAALGTWLVAANTRVAEAIAMAVTGTMVGCAWVGTKVGLGSSSTSEDELLGNDCHGAVQSVLNQSRLVPKATTVLVPAASALSGP